MADNQLLRIGKISSFNYPKGTARVTYEDKDGETTPELPFVSFEYWMPKVGDQVLVGHLSTGTCAGVILGPVWHNGMRPVEGFEGLYRKEYSNKTGQANERYDAKSEDFKQSITGTAAISATKAWSVQVGGAAIQLNEDGTITITASGITVKAPTVTVLCDETTINGSFTTKGGTVNLN